MRAVATQTGLARLEWQQTPFIVPPIQQGKGQKDRGQNIDGQTGSLQSDVSRETIHQLDAYLAGKLSKFTIPLDLSDISAPLQKWLNILRSVPYGTTISYADYAEKWGNRGAAPGRWRGMSA